MSETDDSTQQNVFGEPLKTCSEKPLTGWFRDGCCHTDDADHGVHTVWLKSDGNDLVTPHPEFGFRGLQDGDCWCVCAASFARALEAGVACRVYLARTHIRTLDIIPMEKLKSYALDLS
jgi:uncharacterized protein (DUF2237 family)